MQVLLGPEHTIFKVKDSQEDYGELLEYIEVNFNATYVKKNVLYIPVSAANNRNKRILLMKWLYSYYKKNSSNVSKKLKYELTKRLENPIHLYLLPQENIITISATFYENSVCQLGLNERNATCDLYLHKHFRGVITLISENFNLYDVNVSESKKKELLKIFFSKTQLGGVNVKFQYDANAFNYFFKMSKIDELEKACRILNVKSEDSIRDIKKNYKKLAKTFHPDISTLHETTSTKKFQILTDAFEILKKFKVSV